MTDRGRKTGVSSLRDHGSQDLPGRAPEERRTEKGDPGTCSGPECWLGPNLRGCEKKLPEAGTQNTCKRSLLPARVRRLRNTRAAR